MSYLMSILSILFENMMKMLKKKQEKKRKCILRLYFYSPQKMLLPLNLALSFVLPIENLLK